MNTLTFVTNYPMAVARIAAGMLQWKNLDADDREGLSYDIQQLVEQRKALDVDAPELIDINVIQADKTLNEWVQELNRIKDPNEDKPVLYFP